MREVALDGASRIVPGETIIETGKTLSAALAARMKKVNISGRLAKNRQVSNEALFAFVTGKATLSPEVLSKLPAEFFPDSVFDPTIDRLEPAKKQEPTSCVLPDPYVPTPNQKFTGGPRDTGRMLEARFNNQARVGGGVTDGQPPDISADVSWDVAGSGGTGSVNVTGKVPAARRSKSDCSSDKRLSMNWRSRFVSLVLSKHRYRAMLFRCVRNRASFSSIIVVIL